MAEGVARGDGATGASPERRCEMCGARGVADGHLRCATCHVAPEPAARRTSGGGGGILLGVIMLSVASLPALITGAIWLADGGLPLMTPLLMLIVPVGVGPSALRLIRRGRRERRLARHGVLAQAVVLGAERTGLRVNQVPEVRITVTLLLEPPVRSHVEAFIDIGSQHLLTPGTRLTARVDPLQPDYALLET